MFGLNPWILLGGLLVVLAAAASGAAGGYKLAEAAGEREINKQRAEWTTKINKANERADDAAAGYELAKRNLRPKIITITKKVKDAVQAAPEWSAARLPDGLRDAINSFAPDLNTGELDRAVPAAPAKPPSD